MSALIDLAAGRPAVAAELGLRREPTAQAKGRAKVYRGRADPGFGTRPCSRWVAKASFEQIVWQPYGVIHHRPRRSRRNPGLEGASSRAPAQPVRGFAQPWLNLRPAGQSSPPYFRRSSTAARRLPPRAP